MFDRSLLDPALFEFVVIADTHLMLDTAGEVEFESRRRQTARAEAALRLAASLRPAFVIHLGDLVQVYPDTAEFPRAMAEAQAQLRRCGVEPRFVAGNHDVGDKPDPTMPTSPVTAESLAWYHARFGTSWYSFDHGGCHFVIVNTQIMNSALSAAKAQQEWLEKDLAGHEGQRMFLFLHLPLFLCDERESALGHYDNLDEPARGWLLALIRRYHVELLVAAHVHFAFYDRIDATRYLIAQSPSFSRPGFSHVFASGPPPERGRDDTPKLGFYLLRVCEHRVDTHLVRTDGTTASIANDSGARARVITRLSSGLADSPLGLSLRHPLSTTAEVPLAWPSVIRQRVRNDYPLLACLELGARYVRAPVTDFADEEQRRRLLVLRDDGVRVVATGLWSEAAGLPPEWQRAAETADEMELQVAGTPWPSDRCLQAIRGFKVASAAPLTLSCIVSGEATPGKQHPRTRIGYRIEELSGLNAQLATVDIRVDRVLCRVSAHESLWDHAQAAQRLLPFSQFDAVDFAVELRSQDDLRNANSAAEARVAVALAPGSRVYVEPLIDLDRTMDAGHGVLDTLCNPRAAFHTLRCLNSILRTPFEVGVEVRAFALADIEVRVIVGATRSAALLLAPVVDYRLTTDVFVAILLDFPRADRVQLYHLCEGTVEIISRDELPARLTAEQLKGPTLIVGEP